jgi:hypothetical protein
LAFLNDESLRRFANAALGKDKRVMSVILSDCQTAKRERDVNCQRLLFMRSSMAKNFGWEYLLMVPINVFQRLSDFRLLSQVRDSRRNSITCLKVF